MSYQPIDPKQMVHLPPGLCKGVVIPSSSDRNEESLTQAMTVHVDPDASDGGFMIDFSKINHEIYERAIAEGRDKYEALRLALQNLQVQTRPPTEEKNPEQLQTMVQTTTNTGNGFETLKMDFLTGPRPEKPKCEVFFNLPAIGQMSVRYHAVCEGNDCLALVYDIRYEDGQQFLPPDLGEKPIEVAVAKVKQGRRVLDKFICSSLGIHFNVGVLDIVVLIRHRDQTGSEYKQSIDDDMLE